MIEILNKDKSITLDSYVFENGILITSFDEGEIPATFNKVKGVNQIGSSLNHSTLETRNMTLEAMILGEDRIQIEALKSSIDSVLNPMDDLIIKYTDDYKKKEIKGRVVSTPKYSSNYNTNNDNALALKIDIECFNPLWADQVETIMNVETWIDGFEFEFELNSLGIEFARKGPNEVEIINGNIEAPLEIYFKGPALNPQITLNDNSFIKVNKTLQEGETLYIRTNYGDKEVKIIRNGLIEQAYHYLDIDSRFFNLNSGKNKISYRTDGDFLPQSVVIKFKKHYLSL